MQKSESDLALDYADEAKIKASEYKQIGFKELAKWLNKNADEARSWASMARTQSAGTR